MKNTKANYICKSIADFRKSHSDFLEHKEFTGKKKLTVFIDPGIFNGNWTSRRCSTEGS